MPTFVMMTRLASEAVQSPHSLEQLERKAMERVRKECPDAKWVANYAVLGPWDYLDIFEAPNVDVAAKVSTLIRSFGHAHTEIWSAIEWSRFKDMVRNLPSGRE